MQEQDRSGSEFFCETSDLLSIGERRGENEGEQSFIVDSRSKSGQIRTRARTVDSGRD